MVIFIGARHSYSGELSPEISVKLGRCKELAQSQHRSEVSLAQIQLDTHTFEVNDKGRSIYPYVLKDGWYTVQVSKLGAINKPLAYVQIASALLSTKSLSFVTDDLRAVIHDLGTTKGYANISRLDLCCDFTTDYPFHEVKDSQWLTRARVISRHLDARQFSGFSIGAGGHLTARLYNKTLEMQKNPRPYLQDMWTQAGWNGFDTVWRLEFQFRREAARELGVFTELDIKESLSGLWNYASGKWLRLAEPNPDDATPCRWPVADVWNTLQAASWSGVRALSRLSTDKTRLPADRTLFINGISALTSYMAIHGIDDPQVGARKFMTAAKEYHDNRELFTGVDFYGYLAERVRGKQRLFNTGINPAEDGQIHPADQAVITARKKAAEDYRKARDDE